MAKVKGTVTGVGKGKFSYFIKLGGNEFYYNTKFEPKCGEGDVVGIEFTQKGETRGNVSKVVVLESNSSGYPGDAAPAAPSGGGYSKAPAGNNDRQDSICWQSSRKDALVLVDILLKSEAFAIKGKADAKRVQIEELLDEVTARFFEDALAPRESAAYKGAAEVTADAADEPPDDGDNWDDEPKSESGFDNWED